MRLKVTVRHGHVNDGVRSYVESKFAKLGRRLHDETLVEVVLDRERNPKIADDHLVEAEVHMKGPNLHGREAAPDVRSGDRPARRQARAADRAPARQGRPRAAAARPGRRAAGAGPGRGDRAVAPRDARRLSRRSRAAAARPGASLGRGRHPRAAPAAGVGCAHDRRRAGGRRRRALVRRARRRPRSSSRRASGDARAACGRARDRRAVPGARRPARGSRLGGRRAADRDGRARSTIPAATRSSSPGTGRERTVRIDGAPTLAGVPELERLGSRRSRDVRRHGGPARRQHVGGGGGATLTDGAAQRSGPARQLTDCPSPRPSPSVGREQHRLPGLMGIVCSSVSAPVADAAGAHLRPLRVDDRPCAVVEHQRARRERRPGLRPRRDLCSAPARLAPPSASATAFTSPGSYSSVRSTAPVHERTTTRPSARAATTRLRAGPAPAASSRRGCRPSRGRAGVRRRST